MTIKSLIGCLLPSPMLLVSRGRLSASAAVRSHRGVVRSAASDSTAGSESPTSAAPRSATRSRFAQPSKAVPDLPLPSSGAAKTPAPAVSGTLLTRRDAASSLPDVSWFGSPSSVTLHQLFHANAHLGHPPGAWHPNMKPYLFGIRSGIHIINLEHTTAHLRRALNFARHVAHDGGKILFVSLRSQFETLVRETAEECGEYFVVRRWIAGTLTNREQTISSHKVPDLMIFLNLPGATVALREAYICHVPTIGIADSDCDPDLVDYSIPGNDDSPEALRLYCAMFSRAIREGKERRRLKLPLGL